MEDKKIIPFPGKKEIEVEDKTYRLIEMRDSMNDTIDNLKKVIADQQVLINIITSSKESKKFKEFIDSILKQIEHYNDQIKTIKIKIDLLNTVIKSNESENMAKHCSIILAALGVFE